MAMINLSKMLKNLRLNILHIFVFSFIIQIAAAFNTPPIFSFQREFSVYENEPLGSRVFSIRVNDAENDLITYSIDKSNHRDGSKYFKIDQHTGDVYLKESLIGQGGEDLYIYVKAFDGVNHAKCEILIKIFKGVNSSSNAGGVTNTSTISTNNGAFILGRPFYRPSSSSSPSLSSSSSSLSSPSFGIPPLPSNFNIGIMPSSKPKDTAFIAPTVKPSPKKSTTRRPPVPPLISPLNNPKEMLNSSLEIDWSDSTNQSPESQELEVSNKFSNILSTFFPIIYIVALICSICIVCWITMKICHHTVPSRNAIKTFSHKIVNNNKSDSNDSAISIDTEYSGALFLTKKSSLCKEFSSMTSKSFLKVTENEWEIPRHQIKFIHLLGEGCFGQVWKCDAVNIGNNGCSQVVAVKTLKQHASSKEKSDLLEELEVMKLLEPHPNVVTLIGCCADQEPVLLIMEYVPNGTLQNYLRESRVDMNYGNLHGSSKLTSRDLVSFAYQIAKGMQYLSSKGIIHRDLAARNVLVGYNKGCKIADFGFAKYDHVYEKKSQARLPIRWMAVESLTDFVFTTKSDVWSFGILLWEIVTLGWTPYPGLTAAEVIKKVCEGVRLEKPEHCKRDMYNIMYYCWDHDPNKRPSFSELVEMIDKIFFSDNDYIELDRFPDHAYYNILNPANTADKV